MLDKWIYCAMLCLISFAASHSQKSIGLRSELQWRSYGTLRSGARNILAPPINKNYKV